MLTELTAVQNVESAPTDEGVNPTTPKVPKKGGKRGQKSAPAPTVASTPETTPKTPLERTERLMQIARFKGLTQSEKDMVLAFLRDETIPTEQEDKDLIKWVLAGEEELTVPDLPAEEDNACVIDRREALIAAGSSALAVLIEGNEADEPAQNLIYTDSALVFELMQEKLVELDRRVAWADGSVVECYTLTILGSMYRETHYPQVFEDLTEMFNNQQTAPVEGKPEPTTEELQQPIAVLTRYILADVLTGIAGVLLFEDGLDTQILEELILDIQDGIETGLRHVDGDIVNNTIRMLDRKEFARARAES